MTQAVNLANFANNLDSSGGVNPSALNAAVAVAKGGTGSTTAAGARTSLDVPTRTGTDASGNWDINITGNAATVTNGVYNNSGTYNINVTGSSAGINATSPNLGLSVSGQDINYGSQGGPQVQGQGGGAAMMSFHRPGAYAINFGLGTDGNLRTGGWSRGGNHVVLDTGNFNSYAPAIGVNQTWQNVGASRAANTTYVNTTGKPIMVNIYWGGSNGAIVATVNGVGFTICSNGGFSMAGSVMVPVGATYSINAFSTWHELR
jgi:hypothetical protein